MTVPALPGTTQSSTELAAALARPELTELDLTGNVALAGDVVRVLLESGALPRLRSLNLTAVPLGDVELARLVCSGQLEALETLLLGGVPRERLKLGHGPKPYVAVCHCELGPLSLQALASARIPRLETLELSYALAPEADWLGLARGPLVRQLRRLGMSSLEPGLAFWTELFAAAGRLEVLALSLCRLGDDGAKALAQAACAPSLRRLAVPLNRVATPGIQALVDAPFPLLESLDLWGSALDQGGLDALAHRKGTPRLRALNLHEKTVVPTGKVDVWFDQGFESGSEPGTAWLYELADVTFRGTGLAVTEGERPWPRSWLSDFPRGV